MRLPNLVLAGFPKCGTTSVADTLAGHPEAAGAFPQLGTRYFTPLLHDPAAVLAPVSSYADRYRRCHDERVLVDHTPVWVYGGERLARRVSDVLGTPSVLVMLREPASRTASYLTWKQRHGEIDSRMGLAEYVALCREHGPAVVESADPRLNVFSGLYGSDYARFLPAWLDVFGDSLRIGYVDDLQRDQVGFFRAVAEWLRITPDDFDESTMRTSNSAKTARSPRAERAIRRVGRRVQPLAVRTPALYRVLRDSARRANMTDPRPPSDDDRAAAAELAGFFGPSLRALREQTAGRELLGTPAWLSSA